MTTKRSPIKFSLGKLLSQLKINNNNIDDIPSDKEIISLVPNVLMIPYDVLNINGSNDHGTLCLIKCKKVDRNHLSFYISMDKEPEWDIILDRYSQITRPRPNLLSVFSYVRILLLFELCVTLKLFIHFFSSLGNNNII